jgi:hypothetical protein
MGGPRPPLLLALAPAAAFAVALSIGWRRWGDVVIDWGRELEIARRLAAGDSLYTGVHYWYGPLAPQLNALLFSLFGVHAGVLQAAGLCSAVLMTGLLWALAQRVAGAAAAATVTTAFVALCAFGHYYVSDIFNWVTPYAYPATYGMLLATASLYALVRALEPGGGRWFGAALALLALTLVTKLEPAFAALAAHAAFAWVTVRRGERRMGRLALAYATVLAAVALASGGFATTVVSLLNPRTAVPVVRYMGGAELGSSLSALGWSALRLGACLAAPIAAVRIAERTGVTALGLLVAAAIPIAAFAGVAPELALRGLPVVVLLGLADAVRRGPEAAADLVLWAFAAGALARLPLSAGAHHYGFYLLPVPLAVVLLLFFRRLPARLGEVASGRLACDTTAAALVAALAWTHLSASAAFYRQHTVRVATPRGDLTFLDATVGGIAIGRGFAAAVERLQAYPPGTTVFAAPEGAGLAFLAGLPTWGADLSYYPPATGPEADKRLRAALEADPPGVVLLLNVIDLRHYGVQGFGRDYATESVGWLQQHYQSDRIFPGNTIVIARPKETAVP